MLENWSRKCHHRLHRFTSSSYTIIHPYTPPLPLPLSNHLFPALYPISPRPGPPPLSFPRSLTFLILNINIPYPTLSCPSFIHIIHVHSLIHSRGCLNLFIKHSWEVVESPFHFSPTEEKRRLGRQAWALAQRGNKGIKVCFQGLKVEVGGLQVRGGARGGMMNGFGSTSQCSISKRRYELKTRNSSSDFSMQFFLDARYDEKQSLHTLSWSLRPGCIAISVRERWQCRCVYSTASWYSEARRKKMSSWHTKVSMWALSATAPLVRKRLVYTKISAEAQFRCEELRSAPLLDATVMRETIMIMWSLHSLWF